MTPDQVHAEIDRLACEAVESLVPSTARDPASKYTELSLVSVAGWAVVALFAWQVLGLVLRWTGLGW